jgi:hypothetical protein
MSTTTPDVNYDPSKSTNDYLLEIQNNLNKEKIEPTPIATNEPPTEPIIETEPTETEPATPTEPAKNWKDILADEKAEEERVAKEAARLKKAEEIENDELYNFINNLRQQGKDDKQIKKAIKDIVEADPSEYSEQELFEMTIANELNEYGDPLTKEEKESQYELFKTMSKSVQDRTLSAQKAELENRFKEATKLFAPKSNDVDPATIESAKVAYDTLMVSLDEMVGKEVLGVNITNKIAIELHNEAKNQLKLTFKGGNYDPQSALDNALAIKLLPHIVKDEVRKAESATAKRLFKEFHSPSATGKPIVTTPRETPKSESEKVKDQMDSYTKRQNDPMGLKN